MEYTATATGTTVQYWDIMNSVCLCEAKVARTSVVLCDNMHSCQLLTNPDWDTVFSSSAIFNDFKSACLRGLSLHVQNDFFRFRSNIAGKLPLVTNMSRAKAFLSQPSESAIPACLSKMAEKIIPYLASKTSVTTSNKNGNTNET